MAATYNPSGAGVLGGLGSWFGVATPAYAGEGQPISSSSGFFGGSTPAYKTRVATTPVTQPCVDPERITIVIPRELVESQS